MKLCSRCAQEIPESATTCEHCGDHATVPVTEIAGPLAVDVPDAPAVPTAPQPQAKSLSKPALGGLNRRALLAVMLLVVGGVCTLALLIASTPAAVPMSVPTTTHEPVAPAHAAAAVVGPTWSNANREWLSNARRGAAFEVRAVNKVPIWQAVAQPTLVVRCESGRIETFVYTASAIQMEAQDENHTVLITFDDEPQLTERWADSSDHDALFAPDGAVFARRLMQARTLRVGYTPHNALPAVAEFHVSGLGNLIQPAARSCGWK
jgi:Type VI secretion system VasI, EvfG, VC_A0118